MYFVKARKHIEEQDATNVERIVRDRYQRSESARLLLQALPQQQSQDSPQDSQRSSAIPTGKPPIVPPLSSSSKGGDEFRPEDLPDGACYRPKKEIQMSNGRPMSPVGPDSEPVDSPGTQAKEDGTVKEFVRSAQYVGTFSVSGSDKKAREKQMEQQLTEMKDTKDATPVRLIVSQDGVKVVHDTFGTCIMEHSLKRIWYATCDPESCQFSFLAREPKTSAQVQYCHAFLTETAQQAEELIGIMGEAFKATTTTPQSQAPAPPQEAKKQPTFHELIEQQVQQQQAKFREIEKEAKVALQQKLTEIATPTPFSGAVMHRMGQRRMSCDEAETINQKNRMWAKQLVNQQHSHPVTTRLNNDNNSCNSNRRSEIPLRHSTPQSSPLKRNSVPALVGESSFGSSVATVPSSPAHPLSALAIKESIQSSTKFKGSPVTALKNEIDRRLVMDEGPETIQEKPTRLPSSIAKEKNPPKSSMANRPLPSPPGNSGQEPKLKSKGGRTTGVRERHSFDDNSLSQGSPDKVRLRNSPRRGAPRPMSEIAVSSSGHNFQQQRQSLLQNFASSFSNSAELEAAGYDTPFMYNTQQQQQELNAPSNSNAGAKTAALQGGSPARISAPTSSDAQKDRAGRRERDRSRGRRDIGQRRGKEESPHPQSTAAQPSAPPLQQQQQLPPPPGQQQIMVPPPSIQAHRHQQHPQMLSQPQEDVYEVVQDDSSSQSPSSPTKPAEQEVLRYQNGSPFYAGDQEGGTSGFESLMGLDRSHIHDVTLRNAPWYQAGLPREIALDILQQEEVGSFVVRDSSTHPGCYALSLRVPRFENSAGISHYLILRTHRGVKLKGLDKEWSTLPALVTHHTVMREMLPCTLRLPKTLAKAPGTGTEDGQAVGKEEAGKGGNCDQHTVATVCLKPGKI